MYVEYRKQRELEDELEHMAVRLKAIANELHSRISLSAYPDEGREKKNVELLMRFDAHRHHAETWYISHEIPNFKGAIGKFVEKANRECPSRFKKKG
ncbi:MAG: hypothetical protein UIH27_11100 [Ruminococcus sp.]|nr:hypothetical protein [Ruminococcus sp.]